MPATLTPLRYPGGKTKYADLFADVLERNSFGKCTFVEAFAGGAGSAISLLLTGRVKSLILNDLDVAIYSFWRAVKERPEEFCDLILKTEVSVKEWHRQKAVYEAKDLSQFLELGFATFYLNRSNHSGILHARPIGGLGQSGEYDITARFNKSTSISKIRKLAQFADSIEVYNLDGVAFLKMLKAKHRNRKCLVYFDPPYYHKGPALYLNHFSHEDHEALRSRILRCPFPWVLSYDNNESILKLYKGTGCGIYLNTIRHTIAGNTAAKELIISRLELPDYLERLE